MNKNMSFSVSGQRIELTDAAMLVAGTVNEYTARFTFDESWDGYQRTAVFSCGDISREQLLTDDACTVPWEVLISNGYLRVGVYGTKGESRLPTIWTERRLYINSGAGPTQEAADPSPTLVEQLLGRMGDLAALKTEDKSSLVAAINEVWSSGGSGGASVTDAAINEDGHLIITLSTGASIDAGYAVGPAGPAGQDGAPGKDGAAGAPGKDGVGIQSVEQTTTSTDDGGTNIITVTKSDGSSSTFQVRNGSKGSTGPAGADGAPGKDGIGVPTATAADAGKVPVVQGDGSYGLADRIAPPATAQVGQTIVVKTVDADGKPTEWEAADMSAGGGETWELIAFGEMQEPARLDITKDNNGLPFSLKSAQVFVRGAISVTKASYMRVSAERFTSSRDYDSYSVEAIFNKENPKVNLWYVLREKTMPMLFLELSDDISWKSADCQVLMGVHRHHVDQENVYGKDPLNHLINKVSIGQFMGNGNMAAGCKYEIWGVRA